jgi:hypothetical protein
MACSTKRHQLPKKERPLRKGKWHREKPQREKPQRGKWQLRVKLQLRVRWRRREKLWKREKWPLRLWKNLLLAREKRRQPSSLLSRQWQRNRLPQSGKNQYRLLLRRLRGDSDGRGRGRGSKSDNSRIGKARICSWICMASRGGQDSTGTKKRRQNHNKSNCHHLKTRTCSPSRSFSVPATSTHLRACE